MKSECESKLRLIDTSLDLIWRSSYASVSVDDICEKARVKKGSFYYFFKSKADLFLASCDAHWLEKRAVYDRIFSAQYTPVERFERLFDYIYENQKERMLEAGFVLGCPFASVGSELCTQDERIRSKVNELGQKVGRYYEAAILEAQAAGTMRRDKPAEILANEILAYVLGVTLQARISNSLDGVLHLKQSGLYLLGVESPLHA